MKILFCFTYSKSFLSTIFFDVCKKLIAAGHSVTIYSLKGTSNQKLKDGIPIRIIKKRGYITNYYNTYKIIKDVQPDVVVSNFSYVYPALLAGKLHKVPINIAWFHTESSHTKPSLFNMFIKKKFANLADKVLVNSHRLKKDVITTCSIAEENIYIVPFWTAISDTAPSNIILDTAGAFNIGCPGRLVQGKNQELVLEALSIIKATHTNIFKLYLAGQGDQEEFLKKHTVEKGLTKETNFLGDLSINEMSSFYKKMDLIILPSLYEAFGMVFLEAIHLGVPVLVSDRFGALEFLSPEIELDAFQFDPLDEKELAIKIKQFIDGKGCSSTYFKNLYENHFSSQKTFHSFVKALEG